MHSSPISRAISANFFSNIGILCFPLKETSYTLQRSLKATLSSFIQTPKFATVDDVKAPKLSDRKVLICDSTVSPSVFTLSFLPGIKKTEGETVESHIRTFL